MADPYPDSPSPSPSPPPPPRSIVALVWCGVILLRILVGYQPYSGQDNYHGSRVAYGGDFEAQRHWMELTWSLPAGMGEWYYHDLEYWGLDYPPLSAYQSWLCGAASHTLVGPHSVALYSSRNGALEGDGTHKAFMRATVLILDLLFYGTAVYYLTKTTTAATTTTTTTTTATTTTFQHSLSSLLGPFVTAMIQPAILLMDHGHFQYNTVALGLALWSFYYATRPGGKVLACVLFTCALLFKQMTLYFAPAIFAYLLGTCFPESHDGNNQNSNNKYLVFLKRFSSYGAAVVTTVVVMIWPFVVHGPPESTPISRLGQLFHRIFPVSRGLFEDKVANLWCALSIKPLRLAHRVPKSLQPVAALALTLTLAMPALIKLFQIGRKNTMSTRRQRRHSVDDDDDDHVYEQQMLLLGASCTALSFFLGAFQVHEKSILMPLAPAVAMTPPTMLMQQQQQQQQQQQRWRQPSTPWFFMDWFAIVATWSLWPLLVLDRLQVAYVCTLIIYVCIRIMSSIAIARHDPESLSTERKDIMSPLEKWMQRIVLVGSGLVMMGLHMAELAVTPPAHLPDLFAVLWSVAGCSFYLVIWATMVRQLYSNDYLAKKGTKQD